MELQLRIKMNEKLFLRDPEGTELGRKIVRHSVKMIEQLGFEEFTFKKLADDVGTTEATVYRYFENKHRLLVYITAWYWAWMEYLVMFNINNIDKPDKKITRVIELLTGQVKENIGSDELDKKALFNVVISQGNKVYHTKEVGLENKQKLYKPYTDLCDRIAGLFAEYNPEYPYTHSLASTLLETAHVQYFFMLHLPGLTDYGKQKSVVELRKFLEHTVLASLDKW